MRASSERVSVALGREHSVRSRIEEGTLVSIPDTTLLNAALIKAYLLIQVATNPEAREFISLLKTTLASL